MARKPVDLKKWLVPKLRRISMYWPSKSVAREKARVEVQDGEYKNGKLKFKVMFECAICHELVDRESGQMDHISAVVDVDGSLSDWSNPEHVGRYVLSLLCDESNYQHLCFFCHKGKTEAENIQRAENKKLKKSSK